MTAVTAVRSWIHGQTPSMSAQFLATVIIVAAVILVSYLLYRFTDQVLDRWDPAVSETVTIFGIGLSMIAGMAGVVGVWRASDQVAEGLQVLDLDPLLVSLSVFVLVAAYGTTRLTRRFFRGFATGTSAFSDHQREVVHHVVQVIVYIFAILIILSLWQVDVGNLLLGAGVLGIVLGLAARQTLGAVLAGFVVLFSRPFEVGDWVVIEDNEGTVRDITIVNTRIQTFDGETVVVPNDIVTGTQVVNRSREGRLRVNVDVGVDYEADIPTAVDAAEEAMAAVDLARDSPSPRAVVAEFDDSAVILRMRFWIDDPNPRRYWQARTAVAQAVSDAFEGAGIKIPFPQRELSGRSEQGGLVLDTEAVPEPTPDTVEDVEDD